MNAKWTHSIRPSDYDIFGGLDVDKTSIAVTFVNPEGFIKSMRIPYNCENLVSYCARHFPGKRIAFAYEAGPTGYGLYDQLTTLGYRCLIASASMIPTAPGQRVKTNRLDSKKIAEALRGGQIRSIHIPTDSYRKLRHLTGLRDTFVRQAAANKCRIKALLLFEGIPFPEAPPNSQWSRAVINQLRALVLEDCVRFKLDSLLANLEFAEGKVLETTKEIRRFCRQDPELCHQIAYLMSIPGIGWIVASHLLARIGDWRQIENVRQLGAFLGLVPTEHSTGDATNRGSITRMGAGRLRNKLIQSAWTAVRRDPELHDFYQRVYQKHPLDRAARKAIVAVARKLTTRIFAVLHEQRPYDIRYTSPLATKEQKCPRGRLDASQKLEALIGL